MSCKKKAIPSSITMHTHITHTQCNNPHRHYPLLVKMSGGVWRKNDIRLFHHSDQIFQFSSEKEFDGVCVSCVYEGRCFWHFNETCWTLFVLFSDATWIWYVFHMFQSGSRWKLNLYQNLTPLNYFQFRETIFPMGITSDWKADMWTVFAIDIDRMYNGFLLLYLYEHWFCLLFAPTIYLCVKNKCYKCWHEIKVVMAKLINL